METKSAKKSSEVSTSPTVPAANRLHVGDVFVQDGVEHVVWFLNESRASVSPLSAPLEYKVRDSDGKPQFMCMNAKEQENISPDSKLKIERSLGREGLAKFIDDNKKTQEAAPSMKKNSNGKKTKKVASSTPGIRAGKLGTFEGFSIASVIRTLAKAAWTFAECKAFCDKQKIPASDQTIKLNIYRGTRGIDGEYAPIPKDKMPMKPKIAVVEKPNKPTKDNPVVLKKKSKTPAGKNGNGNHTVTKTKSKTKTAPEAKPERAAEQIAALKSKTAPVAARA